MGHSDKTISWLSTEKLNLTQQKQTSIRNKNMLQHKMNIKTKTKFGCLLHTLATQQAYS